MAPVNLTRARQIFADKVLIDRGTLERNLVGWRNEEFDTQTGHYVTAAEDESPELVLVAADIPCMVKAEVVGTHLGGDDSTPGMMSGRFVITMIYDNAIVPEVGDQFSLTLTDDPRLVGGVFMVNEIIDKTIRVNRKMIGVRPEDVLDRS